MALIKCKECGKEISDKASKCPNCGCKIHNNKIIPIIIIVSVVVLAIIGVIGAAYISSYIDKHKENGTFTEVNEDIFPFEKVENEEHFFDIIYEENNLILVVTDTCEYCKMFSPIVKEVADTYNLKIYTLNMESVDNWTLTDENSNESISIEATPTLYFKSDTGEIDKIEGYTEKEELISILKEKNII